MLNKCTTPAVDQTDKYETKMFPVYLQVIQTAQGMPACSAGFPLLLCQCFLLAPRVGIIFRGKRMGWCLCAFVSAGHCSTGVCLEQLFLSVFLKICKPITRMHRPNFNQVIKVQLSPQKCLKESLTDTLEENLRIWVNHLLGSSGAHKMCIFNWE